MSAQDSKPLPTPTNSPSFARPLFRHMSTPQLETFRVTGSASSVSPVNNYISTQPLKSFSTFVQAKSKCDLRVQDDPNPYSVSKIDEFRIQVQNPYRTRIKSTNHLNTNSSSSVSDRSSSAHYYQELDAFDGVDIDHDLRNDNELAEKLATLPAFFKRGSSVGYDSIIDAEGLSGGSSEDLPPPASEYSEEYLHSLSITTSSGSDGMSPIPEFHDEAHPSTTLQDKDLCRIEHVLKGRKTQIFISDSLANLYYFKNKPPSKSASASASVHPAGTVQSEMEEDWMLKYTGVPVLLLDTGETKSRDKRKLQIVLAELGSGLALWKDTIDHLSNYKKMGVGDVSTFHTMCLSFDHTKVVGLSFDNAQSAVNFWKQMDKLTSDFANISLSGFKHKNKKETKVKDKKKRSEKWVRPSKNDISQPCAFQHVSTLSSLSKDKGLFSSLQHFVTGKSTVTTPASHLVPQ